MKKAYKELMDKVEVTAEMRERVLQNLKTAETDRWSIKWNKILRGTAILAASLALVIGSVAVTHFYDLRKNTAEEETNEFLAGTYGIETADSLNQLTEMLGFSIKEITIFPFKITDILYNDYWGEMSEIVYTAENNTITLRQQEGNEDISGDWNEYQAVWQCEVTGNIVTMKGSAEGTCQLATWSDEKFSYSLYCEKEIKEEEMINMIESIS